eukprot:1046617-Amorphochlora_amoeboformis.AAC.3
MALHNGVDVNQLDDEVRGSSKPIVGIPGFLKAAVGFLRLSRGAAKAALVCKKQPLGDISRSQTYVVELLLKHKPSIDHQDYWDGRTALMDAARQGHAEIVKALVIAGASLTIRDFEGNTAYDHALIHNRNVDNRKYVMKIFKDFSRM